MFEYNDVKVVYSRYGNFEGKSIVLLHGWGQNKEMMDFLGKKLPNYDILTIDLPGFGKSSEPTYAWSIDDYADCVHALVKELNIKDPLVIGHSFGGKVALLYASKYEIYRLISFASPYRVLQKKLSFKQKVLKVIAKISFLKGFAEFMKKKIGSTDYKNASPRMREVLVKHLHYDITPMVKKINVPTLLIWGTNDTAVNLSIAYELNDLIKDAAVIEYPGCTHYAYMEDLNRSVSIIKKFMGE